MTLSLSWEHSHGLFGPDAVVPGIVLQFDLAQRFQHGSFYHSDDGITFTDVGGDCSSMWFISGVGTD